MKFENLQNASNQHFRRITGVKRPTFTVMMRLLQEALLIKKSKGGRPYKLSLENILLMALEYLREYRTYAMIGMSYGLSESNTYQAIKWVESVFAASKEFSLPGKNALASTKGEFAVVLIDATETPIQRPKKNKENFSLERKSSTL